ncbi:hypothetical protein PJP10_31815, partial [Mycobacterium kansasii]
MGHAIIPLSERAFISSSPLKPGLSRGVPRVGFGLNFEPIKARPIQNFDFAQPTDSFSVSLHIRPRLLILTNDQ